MFYLFPDDYTSRSATATVKGKGSIKPSEKTSQMDSFLTSGSALDPYSDNLVIIVRVLYDGDNLVHIRFDKNPKVPREIIKLIGLIARFHPFLTNLTFKMGLDQHGVYEISKFLSTCYITDICFDGCPVPEGNFDILLNKQNRLKCFSLSRCNINDETLKNIALLLHYGKPASYTLAVLNLSCNFITDMGVGYLAEAMRSNRRLNYLNLSGNQISDDGAKFLFNILDEFHLNYDEILEKKSRRLLYLKEKHVVLSRMIKKIKAEEADKKVAKSARSATTSAKKSKVPEKEPSVTDARDMANYVDPATYEKAELATIDIIGEFIDPFSPQNSTVKDGYPYCLGNNALCYLNLSFNNLTYNSLPRLVKILEYQKYLERKPKGLINVVLNGNNIPVSCRELAKIDDILIMNLLLANRRMSMAKKKMPGRLGK